MTGKARRRAWVEARHALADPGTVIAPIRTAPLEPGVRPDPWDCCDCDYAPPTVDGKQVPQRLDPAWSWIEDKPKFGDVIETSLRPQVELLLWGDEKKDIPALYPLGGFHSGDPRFDSPGFPDLILWSPLHARPIAREFKRMGRFPEIVQATHLTSMRRSGWDVGIWQPCCLLSGHISRCLSAWSGVPLHRLDPFARLGPAKPLAGFAAAVADHKAGRKKAPAAARVVSAAGRTAGAARADDGDLATGYVLNLAGTIDEPTALTIGKLRAWAVDAGVARQALIWPWRLVVTDRAYHLQIRDLKAAGRPLVWAEIARTTGDPVPVVALIDSLHPRRIAETGVRRCQEQLTRTGRQPEARGAAA